MNVYNWTVPKIEAHSCIMRIRLVFSINLRQNACSIHLKMLALLSLPRFSLHSDYEPFHNPSIPILATVSLSFKNH